MSDATRGWLALIIIIVSGVLAFSVIVLPLILPIFIPSASAYQVPDSVREWGGIIIGFYFGSSINLIKDLIGFAKQPAEAPPLETPHPRSS